MALTSADSAEWILEAAWLAALNASEAITALVAADGVKRLQDHTGEIAYPLILIDCQDTADDPQSDPLGGDYVAEMLLDCRTYRDDDLTGRVVNQLKRAVRDVLESAALYNTLEAVGQLKIYGVRVQDQQLAMDSDAIRSRGIVLECRFSVTNEIPEQE